MIEGRLWPPRVGSGYELRSGIASRSEGRRQRSCLDQTSYKCALHPPSFNLCQQKGFAKTQFTVVRVDLQLRSRPNSLHLDAHFGAHVLEHDADGVNDFLVRMGLAILDYLMLGLAAFLVVKVVLMRQAVVPA